MIPILDVAIGLVFVFLLFSLIISALNELVLSYLNKRADFLYESLAELLADREKKDGGPLDTLLKHGLVDALTRDAKGAAGKPSYLPPKVFVTALLDQVAAAKVGVPRTMADINAGIDALTNEKLKQSLTAIAAEANQDLAAFKTGLETWFNQAMDRVSGWYKRYAQQWMIVFGFVLAIACDIDSIDITRTLSADPQLRESLVKQAVDYVGQHPNLLPGGVLQSNPPPADSAPAVTNDPAVSLGQLTNSINSLSESGLPIGWNSEKISRVTVGSSITIILGCLVTALAGSLGAPFWFDTLNRFINIRGCGRAPEEGDPTNPRPSAPPGGTGSG